jgi:hypothetical protein
MSNNKSVLEEALLEAQQLEEAVKSNAKEILAATMKQEIEELVKESLNEQEVDDLVVMDDEEEVSLDFDDADDEEDEDLEDEGMMFPDEEEAMVSMEMDADGPLLDLTMEPDETIMKVFKAMGAKDGIIVSQDGDTIDIEDQGAGTEYKIELAESRKRNNLLINEGYGKKDSMEEEMDMEELDEMKMKDMYEMKKEYMDEMKMKDMYEMKMKDMEEGMMGDDDEPVYEISLEDDMVEMWGGNKGDYKRMDGHKTGIKGGGKYGKGGHYKDYEMDMPEGEHSEKEMGEASRTYGFGSKSGRGLRKGFTPNRNLEYPINESTKNKMSKLLETTKKLQTENQHYREKNKEYRQALKVFRDKLNEVAVFNANLAYSTKLFTEHTTTKKEKINILRRFDNVTTLNESKNLFNTLNSEFSSKVNNLNESVQKTITKKITKTPSGGSSVNLIESKTYESPQIARMREIMGKL